MAISSVQSAQNVYTDNITQINSTRTGESEELEPKDLFSYVPLSSICFPLLLLLSDSLYINIINHSCQSVVKK